MNAVSLKKFLESPSAVFKILRSDVYHNVVTPFDGTEFVILRLSRFVPEVDLGRGFIETPLRRFTNAAAYFTHATRDSGVGRIITVRGDRQYVVEQGPDAVEHGAAREGVEVREFTNALRHGAIWRLLRRKLRQSTKRREAFLEMGIVERDELVDDLNMEIAHLTQERNHLARELGTRGAE